MPPINLSWTRYLSFKSCPLQYHLRYVQKHKRAKSRTTYLVGSIVHKMIHGWQKSGYDDGFISRNIAAVFNTESKGMKFASVDKRVGYLKKAVQGSLLTTSIYRALRFPDKQAVIEGAFNLPFGEGRLVGGLDVYDPEDKVVYDLKMYSHEAVPDARQLLTYGVASILAGSDVLKVGFITPFLKHKIKTEAVTSEALGTHKEDMEKVLASMGRGVSPIPVEGDHCTFCEYRRTLDCPATYRSGDGMVEIGKRRATKSRRS